MVEWSYSGIDFYDASGGVVENSLIENNQQSGIYVRGGGALSISGNEIRNNAYGVYVAQNATPVIDGGNEITGNQYGVYVYGSRDAATDPKPVVTGNSIYDNVNYNYFAYWFADPGTVRLNATGNWWGSTDASVIAGKIQDYTDQSNYAPVVDYGGYLDGPGGAPVVGTFLNGPFVADTSLVSGQTYTVLGDLYVGAGTTLTIPAGVRMEFGGNFKLEVEGDLVVQGQAGNEVVFTSGRQTPKKQDWEGVRIRAGSTASINPIIA